MFVGSPFTTWGYGCFAPVIEELIHETAPLLEAETLYDRTLEQLYTDYVCRGVPVLIWCTINQLETSPGTVWELPSGETFTWPNNEHCMVLVGEQNGRWVCMDPYNGNGRIPRGQRPASRPVCFHGQSGGGHHSRRFFPVNKRESVVSLR